jgi:alkanesulfonate monooxygenase
MHYGNTGSEPAIGPVAVPRVSQSPVELFSTCPQYVDNQQNYLERVADVARWSESCGCTGILVYTDNSQLDPWLVSQVIIQNTSRLSPLVAIQPVYMHPYTVAKMITSLAHMYGRRIYLNMVAGGFKNDLAALKDPTPHDRRYARLIEYTSIIKRLLAGEIVTHTGEFVSTDKLQLTPPLPAELFPGIFVSGSSPAGLEAARELGAVPVKYPLPAGEYEAEFRDPDPNAGMRIGIIARASADEAWRIANARFPDDRRGVLTHQLAVKVSDSVWHHQLSQLAHDTAGEPGAYWMHPFETYKTFCPYLVGSYAQVAAELARYLTLGYRKAILDIPPSQEELRHIQIVFDRACGLAARADQGA